jgi:hypothetical protein
MNNIFLKLEMTKHIYYSGSELKFSTWNSPLKNFEKMFDKGGSIMSDRGIMVQDLFASQDVFVNTYIFERKIPTRSPGGGS